MSMIRANFAELFRTARGRKVGGRPDLSASPLRESRITYDPEDALDFARSPVESRTTDPASPEENELWLRPDKEPPELRWFSGGQTYRAAFAAVEAEPPVALVPDVDLAPPVVPERVHPEGVAYGPLVPDASLVPPVVPNR